MSEIDDEITSKPGDCDRMLESWAQALATRERVSGEVERHLASCAACRVASAEMGQLWTALGGLADSAPSALLRRDFEGVLSGYREGLAGRSDEADADRGARRAAERTSPARTLAFRRRSFERRMLQIGYGLAALLAGVALGVFFRPGDHSDKQSEEVAELRGELRSMRQDVALSMLHQSSASGRLEGVSVGALLSRQDPQVMRALLETLANDPSPNVRLAAVDALASRAGEPAVQQRLGEVLFKEPSPLVQIALADALLSADGERARSIVAPLAKQAGVRPEVKQYLEKRLATNT
jgi:HEAT repeat protein